MAMSHRTGAPLSERLSTSQASMTISSPAVRRYVFRGQKLELLKNKTPKRNQPNLEYSQARNNVTFQYSTRSATDTAKQTTWSTQVYARNTASYLHFVETKLKLTSTKIDSYRHELDRIISLLCDKIESYTISLEERVVKLRLKGLMGGELIVKHLDLLNAKKNAFTEDLKRRIDLMHVKRTSYHGDIAWQFELVKSKSAPFAERLGERIRQLESQIELYKEDFEEKLYTLSCRYGSYTDNFGQDF